MKTLRKGQQVEIYRNLNRRDGIWFSVRDRKTGLVVYRINLKDQLEMTLKNVKFHVSKAGRARVLREKRKNVHALIKAEVAVNPTSVALKKMGYIPLHISYNPYANESFMASPVGFFSDCPISKADFVTLSPEGVRAWVRMDQEL